MAHMFVARLTWSNYGRFCVEDRKLLYQAGYGHRFYWITYDYIVEKPISRMFAGDARRGHWSSRFGTVTIASTGGGADLVADVRGVLRDLT